MKTPRVGIALEGAPAIALAAFFTVILAVLDCVTGTALGLVLTALTVNFFRDPERYPAAEPGVAVSPADGKIVKAGLARDPFTGQERKVVCIFMNIFDVHVNRMPVAGTVERLQYHPGKFLNASLDKASEDNERMALDIRGSEGGQWSVVQIAGLVARRIVCHVEPGDTLGRGARFGLIKFGSRVDLYLPDAYDIAVHVGDRVLAGQTIIARRKSGAQE
jgi:phosphatidylserine decarboxylase